MVDRQSAAIIMAFPTGTKKVHSRGEEPNNSQWEDSAQEKCTGNGEKLTCFYANANSVVGKMTELRLRVQGYDVIGIVETWATNSINDAELAIEGYNMFRVDRMTCKGGGLIMYSHEKLKSSLCNDMMNTNFKESLWCVVEAEEGKFLIGLCYRIRQAMPVMMKVY